MIYLHKSSTNRCVLLGDQIKPFHGLDVGKRILEEHDIRIEQQNIITNHDRLSDNFNLFTIFSSHSFE